MLKVSTSKVDMIGTIPEVAELNTRLLISLALAELLR